MIFSDLNEVKVYLEIPTGNTVEDTKLLLFMEAATDIIEEFLAHKITKRERTEFYGGSGTQKLLLRHRPVFLSPVPRVWVAPNGQFQASPDTFGTSEELVYGDGFALDISNDGDSEQTSSRSGILLRLDQYWSKNIYRAPGMLSPYVGASPGSIKVVYTAGYTVDTLPAAFRLAANLLVARLRILFPLGMFLTSENYEERSVSYQLPQKDQLLELVKPLLISYRNWRW